MRELLTTALIAALFGGLLAWAVLSTQPQAHAQLRNAYWPYSVETQVRDR